MTITDWLTAAGTVVGAIFIIYQLRQLSKQIKLQSFSDYTRRYQEIALHFPEDINEESFVLPGRTDYDRTMRYMRAYFDLSYEEWYLNRQKLIDERFWRIWAVGIKTAMARPAFQQAWEIVKVTSRFGPEFESFIENVVHSSAADDEAALKGEQLP